MGKEQFGKFTARRRFGQNFLVDQEVVSDILRVINAQPGQRILEIGPGRGALTAGLLETGADLVAIEVDRDMVALLSQRYPDLQIQCADVLRADLQELFSTPPWRILGNLPYNISTPLLFRLLSYQQQVTDMVFMLQEEVAQRLVAAPGGRARGRLTVMLGQVFSSQLLLSVPPTAFRPRPAVSSRLVRLVPHSQPLEPADPQVFAELVRAAFSQRRKTLLNSLRTATATLNFHDWAGALAAAGIEPSLRAEELAVEDFLALTREVWSRKKAATGKGL